MRHSTVTAICFALLTGIVLLGTSAFGLESLSDEVLDSTHAASGIRMDFDQLDINYSATEMSFIAHDNQTALGLGLYGSIGITDIETTFNVDGTIALETKTFEFTEQPYFVTDTWKVDDFEHVSKSHRLDKVPEFNLAGRQVIVLDTYGNSDTPFLMASTIKGNLQAVSEDRNYDLATLGISNLKLIDQRTILYEMPAIYERPDKLYCSGEGLAMEVGLRLSIGSIKVDSPYDKDLTFLEVSGLHLRESFQDSWLIKADNDSSYFSPQSSYDFLGKRNSIAQLGPDTVHETARMYEYSTADSDGYKRGMDDKSLAISYENMSDRWKSTESSPSVEAGNMYGGKFMVGNLRQVGFTDYIAGNYGVPTHWNHADQLEWDDRYLFLGWDNQEFSRVAPVHYVGDGDRVDYSNITERPMTFGFKTRDDGSSCMVVNMPLHGSIRAEDVTGYNSTGNDGYLGGNSMGPLVVEGLRVKKLYIEFPGRSRTYTLKTAVGEGLDYLNLSHDYEYMPGRLPSLQPLPSGQKEYNPMGRGVEKYMDRLSPALLIPANCSEADKPGWDQYRTRLDENVYTYSGSTKTLVQDNSFWQIREPYPINKNFKDYYVLGYE